MSASQATLEIAAGNDGDLPEPLGTAGAFTPRKARAEFTRWKRLTPSSDESCRYYVEAGDLARAAQLHQEQVIITRGRARAGRMRLNLGYDYLCLGLYEEGRLNSSGLLKNSGRGAPAMHGSIWDDRIRSLNPAADLTAVQPELGAGRCLCASRRTILLGDCVGEPRMREEAAV
jgi:hypothetical protein